MWCFCINNIYLIILLQWQEKEGVTEVKTIYWRQQGWQTVSLAPLENSRVENKPEKEKNCVKLYKRVFILRWKWPNFFCWSTSETCVTKLKLMSSITISLVSTEVACVFYLERLRQCQLAKYSRVIIQPPCVIWGLGFLNIRDALHFSWMPN